MNLSQRFTIIKASAGSGKTFQLVFHFLTYALRFENPGYYRHILAITFTNAAAAEMKHRVLSGLKTIASGNDKSPLTGLLIAELKLSPEQLQERAAAAYSHMLHHYGELSILTIDSFTHRLVRSFAKDLQLTNDFNLELDPATLQEKAVDRMLEYIGQDELLTQYIYRYSSNMLDEGKTWNPRETLVAMAKVLFTEDGQQPLQKLSEFNLEDIQREQEVLIRNIHSYVNDICRNAQLLLSVLEKGGISVEDIPSKSKGYISALAKYKKEKPLAAPTMALKNLLNERVWINAKAPVEVKERFAAIQDECESIADLLRELLSEEAMKRHSLMIKIKENVYTLGLIDRMNEYAHTIREEENLLLLSDFHRMINVIIRSNDAPFIFERIGARYKHIMVDEFQDTSKMQWMNLIPLIHNCLAEGHENLVVGDAKQSIYRWRSSYVDQFIQLPGIPADFEMSSAEQTFKNNARGVALQVNYRSSTSVIDFNNGLFPELAKQLPAFREVYDEVLQIKSKENIGFVRVAGNHLLSKEDDEADTFLEKEILNAIQSCLADGFAPGDITILVRSHTDGDKCTALLTENNIKYATADNALLIHSVSVRVIMGYFEFSLFPQHRFAAFDVVQSLASIHSEVSLPSFITEQLNQSSYQVPDLKGFLGITFGDLSQIMTGENVFHQAISLIRMLRLPIDRSTEYLLELIKQQCIGKNYDLHRFVAWWKENHHKQSAKAGNQPDAIQIMTIHKSKGLEFPAVIIPRFADKSKTSPIWIDVPSDISTLPTAYISVSGAGESDSLEENEDGLSNNITLEQKRRLLDEINTLYVACTRASERLYFFQKKGGSLFNKQVDNTLSKCFPQYAELGFFEIGVPEKYATKKATITPIHISELHGKEVLFPKLKLRSKLERDTPEIIYGKLLHECLALLDIAENAEQIIERVVAGNLEAADYRHRLLEDLLKVMGTAESKSWFDPGNRIFREHELVAASGETMRPDRVVVSKDKVVVIDYKSGAENKKHLEQVSRYKNELQKLYQLPIEGYLLYTEGPTICPV
jgi:ATP-dependent exoDNAse (exonuclease V) beta subunit